MRVTVGRVARAHGIRGEVVVEPRTDRPQRRFAPGSVLWRADGPALTVGSVRGHGERLVVRFRGVRTRDEADRLRGLLLEVDLDESRHDGDLDVDLDVDQDLYPDALLVGLRAVDTSGSAVGVVVGVEHPPMHDLLVIRDEGGQTRLVPFVRAIVDEISLAEGYLRLDPPAGLLDLSAGGSED